MVEAVHDNFIANRHRWGEPGFKIRTSEFLKGHCAASESRFDEERITKACNHLLFYSGVIGKRHFNGGPPDDANLFVRTSRVCIDELFMCYPSEAPPSALVNPKGFATRCAAIATIVKDMYDVFTRADTSQLGFKAEPVARSVVEMACGRLVRRFPPGNALHTLETTCAAVIDAHEEALTDALIHAAETKQLDLEAIGRLTRCTGEKHGLAGEGVQSWSSSFATRTAMGTAREALDREEIEPSELVERLLRLPEHQLLDAAKDPEGLAGGDGVTRTTAASGDVASKKKKQKKSAKKKKKEEL